MINVSNKRVTIDTFDQLKHKQHVLWKYNCKLHEAVVYRKNCNSIYICQNVTSGAISPNRFGYKFSYYIPNCARYDIGKIYLTSNSKINRRLIKINYESTD